MTDVKDVGVTKTDIDGESRTRIVYETDKSFFVEAGAGSGKTTKLVDRMVAMVEAGIPIEEISAITFTKAAAGEFYERFQKQLIKRGIEKYNSTNIKNPEQELPPPTDESRARCVKALQNIDLCFMGTIDSFCNVVIGEHPIEAGVPSDARLISDEEAKKLYQQYYKKVCAGEFDSRVSKKGVVLSKLAEEFSTLLWKPEEVFAQGLCMFMDNRNADFVFDDYKHIDWDTEYREKKEHFVTNLKFILDNAAAYASSVKDTQTKLQKLPNSIRIIGKKWSTNFPSVIKAVKDIIGLRVVSLDGMPYDVYFKDSKKKEKEISDVLLKDLENYRYTVSMNLFGLCAQIFEEEFKTRGYLTYFDYLYYLREMLREDAKTSDKELIKYIGARHKYFLIDEFQDTNPLQAEVFFYLASDNPDEDWQNCKPRAGGLFIVGDPKQSIYRFRGADVASFLNVKKIFEKNCGDVLYLTRNYRSTKRTVSYFNEVFSKILSETTADQSAFQEIPEPESKLERDGGYSGIYTYTTLIGKLGDETPEYKNENRVFEIIKRLVNNPDPDYWISTKENPKLHPIDYSEIMVISGSKKNLTPIMVKLGEENIPFRVEGKVTFECNEGLKEIFKIYNCIANAGDNLAIYAALSGSILHMQDAEIIEYIKANKYLSLNASDDLLAKYKQVEKLKQICDEAKYFSPASLFSFLLNKLEVFKFVEAEQLEVLYYTLELLRDGEASGTLTSLKSGAQFINQLIEAKSDIERCLSLKKEGDREHIESKNNIEECDSHEKERGRVHLANLHKVKGLEAPIVILSYFYPKPVQAELRIERADTGNTAYMIALLGEKTANGGRFANIETSEYAAEENDEKASLKAEKTRLQYVGATRAMNVLLICDSQMSFYGNIKTASEWEPLFKDMNIPDFFETVPENSTPDVIIRDEVTAESIYDAATSVLEENRDMEVPSYSIARPSSSDAKAISNLKEEDLFGEEESSDISVIHRDFKQMPKVVELEISVNRSDSDAVHKYYQEWGSMVHKLMEEVVSSKGKIIGFSGIDKKIISAIIDEFWKSKMGSNEPRTKEPYKNILTAIANAIINIDKASDTGKCLSAMLNSEAVYCEVPFDYKDKKLTLWTGVIDAVYKENKSDKWHIIDYKTNSNKTVEDLQEEYKNQMGAYIQACVEILGVKDVDATLFHIKENVIDA